MFGMLGQGSGPIGGAGPAGDLIPDPDFNNPADWNTNGNAVVSGGTITSSFSLTPGTVPTITDLTAPTVSGQDYTLTIVALANPLGGRAQTRLFNSGTSASQLIYNGIPEFTTVEVPVTANAVYDQLRIVWTDEAVTLDRLSLVEAVPPPSLEMLKDTGFDNPPDWTSDGGATVTTSQLISFDDSGAAPTYGALRDEMGGAFIPGATYRLRGTIGVLPGGAAFQIWLWSESSSEIVDGFSSGDPIDQTFVAGGAYTAVQIRFYEVGIRLNDLSIELVPP